MQSQTNVHDIGAKRTQLVSSGARMCYFATVILVIFISCYSSLTHANPPVISLQGGCIAPTEANESIRMDVMRVILRAKRDSYSVDALYHLYNTGETTTIAVGVPKYGKPDWTRGSRSGKPLVQDFIGFSAWVNGQKVDFVEVPHFFTNPGMRPIGGYCDVDEPFAKHWMRKRVTFKGKATTVVRVRYEAHYHSRSFHSGIVLETGYFNVSVARHWKDEIRKATFVSDHTDIKGDLFGMHIMTFSRRSTDFISFLETRQWVPSEGGFVAIDGSFKAAVWRSLRGESQRLGPGDPFFAAPTPCDN